MMAENKLYKWKRGLSKKVKEIYIKIDTFLEITKIKTQINALEQEADRIKKDAGSRAYELWQTGLLEAEKLDVFFLEIKGREDTIVKQRAYLLEMEQRQKQVVDERLFCSNCGTEFINPVNFCIKCGNRLNQ